MQQHDPHRNPLPSGMGRLKWLQLAKDFLRDLFTGAPEALFSGQAAVANEKVEQDFFHIFSLTSKD